MSIESSRVNSSEAAYTGLTFVYDGVEISPHELFERYAASPHGKYQAQQTLRFAQRDNGYAYEPRQKFLEDLGDDVHPVRHMLYTHDAITVPLIEHQQTCDAAQKFTEDGINELRTTAVLHDIGECTREDIKKAVGFTPVGDVKYGTALPDSKQKEKIIRNYLYEIYYSDLPPRLLKRVDDIDLKVNDDFETLAFDAIERLGYYTRARCAGSIVVAEQKHYEAGDQRIAQLGRLATIVSHIHYPVLRSYETTFPYIKLQLDELNGLAI